MPVYARNRNASWLPGLVAIMALAACADPGGDGRFELHRVEADWSNGLLSVSAEQSLSLSAEAREALEHGVPLSIETELSLHESGKRTRVMEHRDHFEIRYLPLSDHYQLSLADGLAVKTFPRLRHVLSELSNLDFSVRTGVLPAGEYELLIRTRLDRMRMPPPMRLPAQMSADWRHDSGWTAWPLDVEPGV
jgi:hypothetical protein